MLFDWSWVFAGVMTKKDKGAIGFFVIVSTSWLQDSLILIATLRCFAVLCSHSPGLVVLCLCLACSYFDLGL